MSEVNKKRKRCSLCFSAVEGEDIPVLTIGAYGTPRYLCPECERLVETASFGRNYKEIVQALDAISASLTEKNVEDRTTLDTVIPMLEEGAKRAQKIKDGEWDFSLDEEAKNDTYEIPEELLESEEDRLLDEKEEKRNEKFDRIMSWVYFALLLGTLAFLLWYFVL